jgi:hypothetical protein
MGSADLLQEAGRQRVSTVELYRSVLQIHACISCKMSIVPGPYALVGCFARISYSMEARKDPYLLLVSGT